MVALTDQHGRPITRSEVARVRMRALIGDNGTPYDASDRISPEMASWNPWLGSPDTETTPYRDISVARQRDLIRNDGSASGIIVRTVDAVIGGDFRVTFLPDYRSMARRFGSGYDEMWAKEYSEAAEAGWRAWAYDPKRYCDLHRRHTFTQMARLAFRHYLVEGEAIAALPYRPDRIGRGGARYATTVQIVDPDRLSNPQNRMDTDTMRGGVELDADGAAIAYYLRKAHQNDWFAAGKGMTWERVERETEWGRPNVVHHFDDERAGQHRPAGGIFTPVLSRLRMMAQMQRVELQAAIVNATFGAYITSPFDTADVQASLEEDDSRDQFSQYQKLRNEFHQDRRLSAGNVRMPTLFPGEKIETVSASRPNAAFDAFEAAMLRNIATAVGLSYATVSADYRGSSYSSARQEMLEAYRTLNRRRLEFASAFCVPIAGNLVEEQYSRGELPMPGNGIDFVEAQSELTVCRFMGPGRGYVDVQKEIAGAKERIAAGLSTMEAEVAEISGEDWENVLAQRAIEEAEAKRLGLTLTLVTTGGQQSAAPAPAPDDTVAGSDD